MLLQQLFKLLRKAGMISGKICRSFRVLQLKSLYPKRFFSAPGLVFGRFFSVHFDASASTVSFGQNVQFRDFCQVRSGMNGQLVIGHHNFFNNHCSINCFHEIVIGDDCQFGEGVKFYDHNHAYKNKSLNIAEQGYTTGAIKIGNNCWFGSDVIILKDVEIGDNVIIGAGCVIHKSVPSGTVVLNKQEYIFIQNRD